MPQSEVVELNNGVKMPIIGFGTWPMVGDEAAEAVDRSIEVGYRLFDAAENYENEKGVGDGLKANGIDRSEVFITTKFNKQWHGPGKVREILSQSLEKLQTDYVDLLLIHWPNPDQDLYVTAWEQMISLREEGLIRAIGVSNFAPDHSQRVIDATGVVPAVNQIQLDPRISRPEYRAYHEEKGIQTQSWSPIGRATMDSLMGDPIVKKVADAHGRTPVQVVLRWHVQMGLSAVPKSANRERMTQNISVFDFELSDADMAELAKLDGTDEPRLDPYTFGH